MLTHYGLSASVVPDWNKEFHVHTDASLYAIGCMLVHQGLTGGHVSADATARKESLFGRSIYGADVILGKNSPVMHVNSLKALSP